MSSVFRYSLGFFSSIFSLYNTVKIAAWYKNISPWFVSTFLSSRIKHDFVIRLLNYKFIQHNRQCFCSLSVTFKSKGWQTTALGPNLAHYLFLYSPWAKCSFYWVRLLGKIKRKFHSTWKLHEIHISISIDKVLDIASLIQLCMVCGGFCATAAWGSWPETARDQGPLIASHCCSAHSECSDALRTWEVASHTQHYVLLFNQCMPSCQSKAKKESGLRRSHF